MSFNNMYLYVNATVIIYGAAIIFFSDSAKNEAGQSLPIDGFIGPKVTSGLCLCIGLLNTVKVMSNEAGLRLLCCGMCFTYIRLFVANQHNINTFPKGFAE